MPKESKHAKTSNLSRRMCDILLSSLPQEDAPRRNSSPSYCGVHIQQQTAALCWVQHTKKHIWVYLDCDDTSKARGDIQNLLPFDVALQARPFPRRGVALRTPLFFKLQTEYQAQGIGPLLHYLSGLRPRSSRAMNSSKADYWHPLSESEGGISIDVEEGNRTAIIINRYERSPKNRKACIETYGAFCCVCGFDFSKAYGEIGKGYIHVHHLTPLAALNGKSQKINPVRDLRPVCPNCHEMLHQTDPPHTIDQLKLIIANVSHKGTTSVL